MPSGMQTDWSTANLADLVSDDLQPVLDTTSSVVAILSAIVDGVATVLKLIATVSIVGLDAARAAIKALIELIDTFIKFLKDTKISMTWMIPTTYKNAPGVPKMLGKIASSMKDAQDPNRPEMDGEGYFMFWAVIGAAPNVKTLVGSFEALMNLFGREIPGLGVEDSSSKFAEALEKQTWPPKPSGGSGMAPDWESLRLADLEPFSTVTNALGTIKDILTVSDDVVEQLTFRIELIQGRVQAINDQVQAINQIIEDLSAAALALAGLHTLQISGSGTTTEQQQAIGKSITRSDYPFKDTRGMEIGAAFVLHFQLAEGEALDAIKALIGATAAGAHELAEDIVSPFNATADDLRSNVATVQSEQQAISEEWD